MLAFDLMVSSEEQHRRGQLDKSKTVRLMVGIQYAFLGLCPPGTDSTYWRLRPFKAYIDRLNALE